MLRVHIRYLCQHKRRRFSIYLLAPRARYHLRAEREVVGSLYARQAGGGAGGGAGASVLEQDSDALHLREVRLVQGRHLRRHPELDRSPVGGGGERPAKGEIRFGRGG